MTKEDTLQHHVNHQMTQNLMRSMPMTHICDKFLLQCGICCLGVVFLLVLEEGPQNSSMFSSLRPIDIHAEDPYMWQIFILVWYL